MIDNITEEILFYKEKVFPKIIYKNIYLPHDVFGTKLEQKIITDALYRSYNYRLINS